ncbi:GNAT family N-acetyltransferase [Mangrovibacterium diazotrophicum]|uniref:RimJ/RimL family protein N-acetyltransferase n=1 Tax=Mangrovibacterium diazotrophicum TaxID=1261403 RepID=A0A419W4Y1_9BACT|nr:GNAT family N-acetyltransferase [Mangrovibacterium diazotrophicum]RKD90480.1 RimJ/RimL family protein N-acetyltransferase [Mangrovibacterium diazotrophicum]
MKPIKLETERTRLRELTSDDADDFYALNLNPEVIRYTGDQPFSNPEEARKFLLAYDQYQKHGTGRLAVIEKESQRFIGWCGLKYTPELQEFDLGFRFFRQYWNRGFATETAMACLDFGFNQLNLDAIVGRAMHANQASIRVLQKIGMSFVKEAEFELHPGVLYQITRDEYLKQMANEKQS